MNWCNRCVLPDTRPNLRIEQDGACNACHTYDTRASIDWTQRAQFFSDVAAAAKARSTGYDCIIPVSGGKDSTWQVVTCLENDLRPLAVTWAPPARTDIGRQNLDNLISLGVDHIDWHVDPRVEATFMKEALRVKGDPAIPMHMALFAIPLQMAAKFRIPLVVWGENSAFEYGGDEHRRGFQLDHAWLQQFGVTHGTTADDWVGTGGLRARDLVAHRTPSGEELDAAGVLAVFLGWYFPWDPAQTMRVATQHGFRADSDGPRTGFYDYADIDDEFISVHHHLKWLKFGFTRLFDNLSLEIRHGRLTRPQALEVITAAGDQTPEQDIQAFCGFIDIRRTEFDRIVEPFRNHDVWSKQGGKWVIEDFLVPDWEWT